MSLDRFVIPANSFGARELYILSFLGAAGRRVGIEDQKILLGSVNMLDFSEEVDEQDGGADRGGGDDKGRLATED
jgi:hypothetical protein